MALCTPSTYLHTGLYVSTVQNRWTLHHVRYTQRIAFISNLSILLVLWRTDADGGEEEGYRAVPIDLTQDCPTLWLPELLLSEINTRSAKPHGLVRLKVGAIFKVGQSSENVTVFTILRTPALTNQKAWVLQPRSGDTSQTKQASASGVQQKF